MPLRETSETESIGRAWPAIEADIERIVGKRRRGSTVYFPNLPERVRDTLRAVFADHGVTLSEFYGDGQTRHLSNARADACARLRRMLLLNGVGAPSLGQIGSWVGLDHSSVLSALRRLEARAAK